MKQTSRVYYRQPARAWTEALPLGNGRLGAMAYFSAPVERILLNEDTLWSGYPKEAHTAPDPVGALSRAREALAAGDYEAAQSGIEREFTSDFSQAYMPMGELTIDFKHDAREYRRALDLLTGVAECSYKYADTRLTREMFVSAPDQALVYRARADAKGAIAASITLSTPLRATVFNQDDYIIMDGECPWRARPVYTNDPDAIRYYDEPERRGVCFRTMALVRSRGGTRAYTQSGALEIAGADEIEIILCSRTSYTGPFNHPFLKAGDYKSACRADITKAAARAYDDMRRDHIADFTAFTSRVSFALDADEADDVPTDERLMRFQANKRDPILYVLIFNFARYLMVSASRAGTTAMNLQGIWNESMMPPWSSNYTININTQMNYWPAEVCALGDLAEPLFKLIEALRLTGAETAREFYGARGAVSHHNTDIWAMSNPVGEGSKGSGLWAYWQMSFGWLSRHLYDHYLYTLDKEFLKTRALPALMDAARFYLDILTPVDGALSISPATSPENNFMVNGATHAVARSAAMNDSIVREVFEHTLSACETLKERPPILDEIRAALGQLNQLKIGSQGQLLEWDSEYEEAEPHHRHTSHLYALYPAHMVTPDGTPELAEACKRSLELRGDDGTGWSLGWKINFWARLNDGDHALMLLKNQLRYVPSKSNELSRAQGGGTYLNLFDAHPPFQIDGNFGAAAGIAEMLIRSEAQTLYLLPALPGEWPKGEAKGLRAMNDMRADIFFADNKLTRAVIEALKDPPAPVSVKYKGEQKLVIRTAGTYEIK